MMTRTMVSMLDRIKAFWNTKVLVTQGLILIKRKTIEIDCKMENKT